MDLKVQRGKNPKSVFQEQWAKLLLKARSATTPRTRVWRLLSLSTECDRAGNRKEAEEALSLAQQVASGDADLVQMVMAHDRMRDAQGGVAHNQEPPPTQAGLLGTPGFPEATYHNLVERYYASYPEERPT